jgi:hypothetical protein
MTGVRLGGVLFLSGIKGTTCREINPSKKKYNPEGFATISADEKIK